MEQTQTFPMVGKNYINHKLWCIDFVATFQVKDWQVSTMRLVVVIRSASTVYWSTVLTLPSAPWVETMLWISLGRGENQGSSAKQVRSTRVAIHTLFSCFYCSWGSSKVLTFSKGKENLQRGWLVEMTEFEPDNSRYRWRGEYSILGK